MSDGTEKHDGIDKAGDCQRDQGTGDIVDAVVDTVSGTLTNTIKGSGAVATSLVRVLSETAHASIQGVAQVGGDLGAAAKGAIIGAWRGTNETSAEAVETIRLPLMELSKELRKSQVIWERRRRVRFKALSLGQRSLVWMQLKQPLLLRQERLKPQAKSDPESQNKFVTPSQAPLLE